MGSRQRECSESHPREGYFTSLRAIGAYQLAVRRGKDGGAVDRCALFVDAGYVLADGAMAVHGTRRADSVSWDYE